MKKKKNGFSLIELIVTIALLAIIGTIITVNLVGLNNKQNAKEKVRAESLIAAAAESYMGVEDIKINTKDETNLENSACITTQFLIDNNYLTKNSIPAQYLNSSVMIDSNGRFSVYLYSDKCIKIDPEKGVGTQKKEYILTYMQEDNKSVLSTEKFTKGNVTIKNTTQSKIGYTFTGWSTKANGSVVYKTNKEYRLKGQDYTLYPVWKKNQYTITYKYNDGKTKDKTQKADYNTSMTLPTPKREGYKFLGWKVGNTSTVVNKKYTITSNITLTAQWMELVPVKIHNGIFAKIEVDGVQVQPTVTGDYSKFYLDANKIKTNNVKLYINNKHQKYYNKINLEQTNNSKYTISNVSKYNEYLAFNITSGSGTNKAIDLDMYMNFEIYTPMSPWIGYISYIITESAEYEYLDDAFNETINNTTYQTIRFKVYDLENANANIMFKKKESSYVEKSTNFELISDNKSNSGYVEYIVNYDFEEATKNNYVDDIGFYYRYKFDYNHAGTKGSSQGPKYYGLYDSEVIYGGYVESATDTTLDVNIFSDEFEAKLYIVTRPEESDGGSALYSYRPTQYACGSFQNVSEEYENFPIASDWNGDQYVLHYQYTSNLFKNNGVCTIGSEMYISGRGPSSEGGNESCGAGCVEFDKDGDFIQGSD